MEQQEANYVTADTTQKQVLDYIKSQKEKRSEVVDIDSVPGFIETLEGIENILK